MYVYHGRVCSYVGTSGADPEILQGGWLERVRAHSMHTARAKFLTTPTFVALAHAHFVGMCTFESVRLLNQSFSTSVDLFVS